MIRKDIILTQALPIRKEYAAEIAARCSRFACTILLEHHNVVLNLKSMIGLLSQQLPADGAVALVFDGPDEASAAEEIVKLLSAETV